MYKSVERQLRDDMLEAFVKLHLHDFIEDVSMKYPDEEWRCYSIYEQARMFASFMSDCTEE